MLVFVIFILITICVVLYTLYKNDNKTSTKPSPVGKASIEAQTGNNDYSRLQDENIIRIIQDTQFLMCTTANLETFFTRYIFAFDELSQKIPTKYRQQFIEDFYQCLINNLSRCVQETYDRIESKYKREETKEAKRLEIIGVLKYYMNTMQDPFVKGHIHEVIKAAKNKGVSEEAHGVRYASDEDSHEMTIQDKNTDDYIAILQTTVDIGEFCTVYGILSSMVISDNLKKSVDRSRSDFLFRYFNFSMSYAANRSGSQHFLNKVNDTLLEVDLYEKYFIGLPALANIKLQIKSYLSIEDPSEITARNSTLKQYIKNGHPSKNGLYPHEILMLSYAASYYTDAINNYQAFWFYGYDVTNPTGLLLSLSQRGFIEQGDTKSAIMNSTAAEVKDILKKFNLKRTGKKEDLVERLIDRVSISDLDEFFPDKKYKLTQKGQTELAENMYVKYVHSNKNKYVYFNIWDVNKKLHDDMTFGQILKQKNDEKEYQRWFGSIDNIRACGSNKYAVLGASDSRACVQCSGMDGKVFDVKDFELGVTAPPFCDNCRCTITPHS